MLIPAPYWTSYPEMARLGRAHPVILDCPTSKGYLLTAQQLRAALTPQSRLLILCTPSNPSGAVYSLSRLQVPTIDKQPYRVSVTEGQLASCTSVVA